MGGTGVGGGTGVAVGGNREQLFEATAALLRALSVQQPLALLLDDLHGATREERGPGLDMNAEMEAVAADFRAKGRKVYVIPGITAPTSAT